MQSRLSTQSQMESDHKEEATKKAEERFQKAAANSQDPKDQRPQLRPKRRGPQKLQGWYSAPPAWPEGDRGPGPTPGLKAVGGHRQGAGQHGPPG